ncbi:hypothetical protein [Haloarcula marismortui]|uniref:Uncharacterized protein n=1 Tax=Haloarcula marismortui (strain ATCC 43049 / DSM 3752 / JCM 8966 / VKM B-1809) TaxID=272569 RepID=A0A4P8JX65_HALMA|nr:hypothetical protein [Haloarcula marismortui]QCP90395.1 hypothetical protein E6P14_05805 [Haloarcula marismortui ATCC 43049]
MIVPQPAADDVPYNDPISRSLDPGSQLTVTFEPTKQVTEFVLPILAVSKHPNSSYEVWQDGEKIYGPAPIPPTDIDDLTATWLPARRFSSKLRIIVRNLGDTTTRTYSIQPIGWEVSG